jgi:two-component system, NtrC family, sensor histidine kinase HydH
MQGYQFHYLKPLVLISACFVALSVVMALSMLSQQESVTRILRENVQSHRAALELEVCLIDLIALEDDKVQGVAVLHARIEHHLEQLGRQSDQPEEQALFVRLNAGYADYLNLWSRLPVPNHPDFEAARRVATRFLESEVLKLCQDFESFNALRLAQSPQQHERVLRQLVWGLVGVGVMGCGAGLVLGYGIARGLARSIQRLQVQIRDAEGKLGPKLPEIVLNQSGDFSGLQADIERLTTRIEAVVRELQARELEVLRAEQLAAVGQLAAGVAHEIRNPLTAIKLLVQSAQEDNGEISREELRVIEDEIRRMERSLNTFLEFARPPKLQRTTVSVTTLLTGVKDLLRIRAERQKVELRMNLATEVMVVADSSQLRQVLLNLGLNALDAMPSGGELRFDVIRGARYLEIRVRDNGPGIPAAIIPRLFTPFASSKDTGLGLGLVISRRIIEDHGGTLTAINRPTGGAELLIWLPTESD